MAITYLEDKPQNSGSRITYLDPEPTVGGIFGKVPVSRYQAGERNILGNVFDRPAAAVRSGLLGHGIAAGFRNPTNVPRFQDMAIDSFDNNTPDFWGKGMVGLVPSAAGLAADVATDPWTYAGGNLFKMAGEIPIGQGRNLGQLAVKVGETPIAFPRRSLATTVDTSISKAIRPSVAGKATATQIDKYNFRAREAVKAIYENKPNLQLLDEAGSPISRLPESLHDFSQSIQQTKEKVFRDYDALAKQAGQQGARIHLSPIASEIERGVSAKQLNLYPNIREYGLEKARLLRETGAFNPEEAQGAVKMLNDSLDAFYKNPTPETASRAVIDSMIANNLRKGLDDAITSATGQAYKPLKQQYASLLSIEKDVNRRAIVHARRNGKGLIDFTDIFAGGDIVQGVLTMNPAKIATGVAKKGIANYIKAINNPDRIVRGMFRSVDKAAKQGRISELTRRSFQATPEIIEAELIPAFKAEIQSVKEEAAQAMKLLPYHRKTEGLGVLVDEETSARRIVRKPQIPPKQLPYRPQPKTNQGVLVRQDANEQLGDINQRLSALSSALGHLRRRAKNFSSAAIGTEIRLMEKEIYALLKDQAGVYGKISKAKNLPTGMDIAEKRLYGE